MRSNYSPVRCIHRRRRRASIASESFFFLFLERTWRVWKALETYDYIAANIFSQSTQKRIFLSFLAIARYPNCRVSFHGFGAKRGKMACDGEWNRWNAAECIASCVNENKCAERKNGFIQPAALASDSDAQEETKAKGINECHLRIILMMQK